MTLAEDLCNLQRSSLTVRCVKKEPVTPEHGSSASSSLNGFSEDEALIKHLLSPLKQTRLTWIASYGHVYKKHRVRVHGHLSWSRPVSSAKRTHFSRTYPDGDVLYLRSFPQGWKSHASTSLIPLFSKARSILCLYTPLIQPWTKTRLYESGFLDRNIWKRSSRRLLGGNVVALVGLWRVRRQRERENEHSGLGSGYSAPPQHVVQPSVSELWCLSSCLRICWFVCFWEMEFGSSGHCSPAGLAVPAAVLLCLCERTWHLAQLMGMSRPERFLLVGLTGWSCVSRCGWTSVWCKPVPGGALGCNRGVHTPCKHTMKCWYFPLGTLFPI